MQEVFTNTDWAELRRQKAALAQYSGEDWAEGLLAFLDAVQDAAEAEGYPAFGPEESGVS
jgi:hypothetical protein